MVLKLMGKKRGMIQRFDAAGNVVACTVIEAEPNVIAQIKTVETDGYQALQVGFELVVAKDPRRQEARTSRPLRGHFAKAQVQPRKHLLESSVDSTSEYSLGQEFGVEIFEGVTFVDVQAVSKGKGYQGVMKRYGFGGGPAAHGSGFHRHGGSIGMRSTPGRVFAGTEMAGRMGGLVTTIQSLRVELIDAERRLLIVRGAVPGPNGSLVVVHAAVKKQGKKK